jgi:2-alkyl-3-oxoalkanoate reductase
VKALVTGGGGFLGRAICEHLVRRGDSVRSFARGDYPDLRALGVDHVRGDIEDAGAVKKAAEGVEVIFHVAAKPGIWGTRESFYGPNVHGTENVIAACRAHGIARLVHTSSPSVVFGGKDLEGVDESTPYPDHFEALYPETKALSERAVLGVNDKNLATVALRPHLIWGQREFHLVRRVLVLGR